VRATYHLVRFAHRVVGPHWHRAFLLLVCLLVRLIALDADPPAWLSWSTGLYTDEGFYTLDARHEALFGTAAPGSFHDRLLSPLLSILQQGVFALFGAGIVQARALSVGFGLLTVLVFWLGLRRAYDARTADLGALLLGLAPPFALYNRLALQETPTVFWLTLAFLCWTYGARSEAYYALAGVSLAVALVFKGLAIMAVGALAAREDPCEARRWVLGGFLLSLALYAVVWYAPHHADLSRMATYYRMHQMQPHSWHSLGLNIQRAFVKGERGVFPYLLATLPVPCLLVGWGSLRRRGWSATDQFLALWLVGFLLFCCMSSYAPSRYYVLFLPPLAGLAARYLSEGRRPLQIAVIALFLLTSAAWYGVSWAERSYSQRDASHALVHLLPPHSIVIGDFAPRLCLDTPFAATTVQPGLANDDHPVESLGATHIVVVRNTGYWQDWWHTRYPNLLQPSRRVASFEFGGSRQYMVDMYSVPNKGNEGSHVENTAASAARTDNGEYRRSAFSQAGQVRRHRPGVVARAAHPSRRQRLL
jgi:4-amino-4-deoxy-L-arabinose transferase-like glycosyltransferase